VANSNLGHFATNANWANGHPEKLNDYAYRGDHETATASKENVNAFYGNGPAHSYFHGCSNGGHQALMEAQRYPDDYEAIIAGAPWNQWTHQTIEFMSRALALEHLDPAKRTMITAAVVAQCGGRDGGLASDGYLNEPQSCRFDPQALLCSGANGPDCLTADEAAAVQKVYDGPSNPRTGQHLYPGFERGRTRRSSRATASITTTASWPSQARACIRPDCSTRRERTAPSTRTAANISTRRRTSSACSWRRS
jgi:feruloyl esterase